MALADRGDRAACESGHSFDFARSGYLNLIPGGAGRRRIGDTPEMIRARAEFLGRGFLEPVAEAVARAATLSDGVPRSVAEIGSGTGYYLERVCTGLSAARSGAICGFGVDLSASAAAHAARAHPERCFLVADVERRVPLADRSAGVVLSVFSPRPAAECARITHPGGVLVAAFATDRHLEGLRERHDLLSVHPDKLERLSSRLSPWFSHSGAETVDHQVTLQPKDVANAIAMGPSARHRRGEARVESQPIAERISVKIARFERRAGEGRSEFPGRPSG